MAKRYWLMKTEPDVYSIDDLERDGRTSWDGVRNYQARNLLRDDVKKGDAILFYHSSTTPPGIAGIAKVSRAAYPDPTAADPKSPYFDAKAPRDAPRWYSVEVELVERFPEILALDRLKSEPRLEGMLVTKRGQRLSVQPVDPEHWRIVLEIGRGKKRRGATLEKKERVS